MKSLSKWLATGVVTVGIMGTGSVAFGQYSQRPDGYEQGRREWVEAPRNEEQEFEQRGFRDGLEGARHDYDNHRRPDVRNRDEYRDPDFIPRPFQHEYREGFERGYWTGVRRLSGDHDRDDFR